MTTLERIFERKREEVRAAKARVPMGALREEAANAGPPRGFKRALEKASTPLALVAEVKKASPSQGLIRADFDPCAIARIYEAAGAHALSVLTDEPFFQGGPENLGLARGATDLPCLRKDFIEEPYQVYEARAWGADALLLIVAALDDGRLADLMDVTRALGMDPLVEVHDESEVERALAAGADLIGVNNRSLADMTTDLATGERLLPLLNGALSIAESALASHHDLERMRAAGARAVLIGTTFCAAPDIGAKVKEVMRW